MLLFPYTQIVNAAPVYSEIISRLNSSMVSSLLANDMLAIIIPQTIEFLESIEKRYAEVRFCGHIGCKLRKRRPMDILFSKLIDELYTREKSLELEQSYRSRWTLSLLKRGYFAEARFEFQRLAPFAIQLLSLSHEITEDTPIGLAIYVINNAFSISSLPGDKIAKIRDILKLWLRSIVTGRDISSLQHCVKALSLINSIADHCDHEAIFLMCYADGRLCLLDKDDPEAIKKLHAAIFLLLKSGTEDVLMDYVFQTLVVATILSDFTIDLPSHEVIQSLAQQPIHHLLLKYYNFFKEANYDEIFKIICENVDHVTMDPLLDELLGRLLDFVRAMELNKLSIEKHVLSIKEISKLIRIPEANVVCFCTSFIMNGVIKAKFHQPSGAYLFWSNGYYGGPEVHKILDETMSLPKSESIGRSSTTSVGEAPNEAAAYSCSNRFQRKNKLPSLHVYRNPIEYDIGEALEFGYLDPDSARSFAGTSPRVHDFSSAPKNE